MTGMPGAHLRAARLLTPLLLTVLLQACAWTPPPQPLAHPAPGTPVGTAGHPVPAALATASRMLGAPYRYGGHSPDTGFDCSGLVYYAHRMHGTQLPRTARAQFSFAHPVPEDALRPGDLLFFRTRGRQVSHVGFYLEPGRMLHAPSTGRRVTVTDYDNDYWRKRFAGAGRIRGSGTSTISSQ